MITIRNIIYYSINIITVLAVISTRTSAQSKTYDVLKSQFSFSIFRPGIGIEKGWKSIKEEYAVRYTDKYLQDQIKKTETVKIKVQEEFNKLKDEINKENDLFLRKKIEDIFLKYNILKTNPKYEYHIYAAFKYHLKKTWNDNLIDSIMLPIKRKLKIDSIKYITKEMERSSLTDRLDRIKIDATILFFSKKGVDSIIWRDPLTYEIGSFALNKRANEFERKEEELKKAISLWEQTYIDFSFPKVQLQSIPSNDKNKESIRLEKLLARGKYPRIEENNIETLNAHANLFPVTFFGNINNKNQLNHFEAAMVDVRGDAIGHLINTGIKLFRYRYFPQKKDTSIFTIVSLDAGISLNFNSIFEKEDFYINSGMDTITLKGKSYNTFNMRLYVGSLDILGHKGWFSPNLEIGADLNLKVGALSLRGGVKNIYNSYFYYFDIGVSIQKLSSSGNATLIIPRD